ncbi:MAG: AhpC/TSA family protein [Leptospiraceae bacterium]|nr:AhpC/TSA family protein [Leptospiraceae bacterium]
MLEQGPVVISFYRGGWCPYCNLELRALQQALPEIKKLGAQLVAISPESPDNSLTTKEKNELEFQVLWDQENIIGKEYGIVFEYPEYLVEAYRSFGLSIALRNGSSRHQLPIPATFVLDQDGIIRFVFAEEDYTLRVQIKEILDCLRKIKL